jgi:high-affinity Fe2+/Pb2+ permease
LDQSKLSDSNDNTISAIRVLFALIVCGLVVAYTVSVVAGRIPKDQQINAVHLGMIALAAVVLVLLLRPKSLERLKLLEMSGFKLEMLEKVKEKQVVITK